MKAERFDEYHKHGCHFHGKLVVVEYQEDMVKDPKWGTFNAGLTFDYLAKAQALVKERYGSNVETLLSVPSLVVRIAEQSTHPTVCRCGDDCIPMLGEDTCVRCELPLAHSG